LASPAAFRAGALRRRRPAARPAAPSRSRTGNPPLRPRELATREQPAATTTRATRASAPSHRQRHIWHLRGPRRSALPRPSAARVGVSRNLSRAPTASLRDRLRRHLTEPARLLADARAREKVHNRDMTQQRRRVNRHGLAGAAHWVRSHLLGWWPRRPPMVGVREPRRPKPTLPAAVVALKEPRAMRWIKLGNRHT
jgi:hypothetical protein